jgi:hypothetical protein
MNQFQWLSGSVAQWLSGSVAQWLNGSVAQWLSVAQEAKMCLVGRSQVREGF